jgi:hypothetical protein
MKRKGEQNTTFWIITAILSVVVILAVLSFTIKGFHPIDKGLDLIGFNTTIAEGNGIIGLSLTSGNLEYFNGERFEKFSNQEVSTIAGYEFNPIEVQQTINNFYFKTERKPAQLVMDINHWRYWEVNNGNSKDLNLIINFKNKNSLGKEDSYEYVEFDAKGNPQVYGNYRNLDFPKFAKIELADNSDKIAQIMSWKDSIVQGGKCEKFLKLNVKQNGVEKELNYLVRKTEGYLVIDLAQPITNGLVEKWMNTTCFEFNDYVDDEKFDITKHQIRISFKDKDLFGTQSLLFDYNNGWQPTIYKQEGGWWIFKGTDKDKYDLHSFEKSLTEGLYELFNTGKTDITELKVFVNNGVIYQDDQITNSDLNKKDEIIYGIIDTYNKMIVVGVN